ncbi:MAG TPA: ParB/RepB/Spo0J family partition protein [Solirubrobacteraceae bacterium]|jgi:ParB/RepB/Spo0J family partition protein|nr:ParB/RepB/Spo0J family partition protein [Solirubrobacteraceae bacterium]
MSTVAVVPQRVALEQIVLGENTRELDQEHVNALANSIALRGLIVPLVVRPDGDRCVLVAGFHRYAACRSLGLSEVEITVREQDGTSADSAAENVVRKALSPLEEARAVQRMLDEGYTLDGAATVLGWSHKLVSARAKILELPDTAQRLVGSGELPISAVGTLCRIAEVSPELCEAALAPVASGELSGEQLASNPGWAIGHALRANSSTAFAAYLSTLAHHEIAELRLGKKVEAAYSEAETLHRDLDRHAYGPPTVRFGEAEIDQARAAGVLIEFEHGTPIITDRALFRELAKQAINRTLQELRAAKQRDAAERSTRRRKGNTEPTPHQALDAEHRASSRQLTARAHGTNLDLGAALLQRLATVDPDDMNIARFFAYALLGPDGRGYLGTGDHTAATIAANGIRLVIEAQRKVTTPTLKSGEPGRTKVQYGDVEDATAWLWKFVDGARSAGELYGRVLVVFAAQHYAHDLVLPASKRRGSVLPHSRNELARKAFECTVKPLLPASHLELRRALDREARSYAKRRDVLGANSSRDLAGERGGALSGDHGVGDDGAGEDAIEK